MSLTDFDPLTSLKVKLAGGAEVDAVITSVSQHMSNMDAAETHIEWRSTDGQYNGSATVPFFEPNGKEALHLNADSFFKHYPSQPNFEDHTWFGKPFQTFAAGSEVFPNPKVEVTVDLSQIEADLAALPKPTVGYAKGPQMHVFATKGEIFLDHDDVPIGKVVGSKLTPSGLEIEVKVPDLSGAIIPQSLVPTIAEVWGVPFDTIIYGDEAQLPKKSPTANAEDVMKEATLEAVETLWVGLHGHSWPAKMNTLNGVDEVQLDDGTTLEVLLTVKPKEVTHDH